MGAGHEKVSIKFCDTGPGIPSIEKLFQPLQQGADATGLGLFLSRAFVRSFGGDLRYEAGRGRVLLYHRPCRSLRAGRLTKGGNEMDRIRLLLVDDHPLFREGLNRLLASEPGLEVVVQPAGPPPRACRRLKSFEVDIILLDFDLGAEHGNQFITSAREAGYTGKILMVTAGMNAMQSSTALKLGASGVILKTSSPGTLAKAIRLVANGEIWIDQKVVQEMADRALAGGQQVLPRTLTEREGQVLQGVFEGLTNKEIGVKIGVSEDSIKTTLKYLFHKTGAKTRGQLVWIALQGSLQKDRPA